MRERAEAELIDWCARRIRRGSLSFSLAARLFARAPRERAFLLYAWCRHCDDAVDEVPAAEQAARLSELRARTRVALEMRSPVVDEGERAFLALRLMASKTGLPSRYPEELLEGMAMDARGEQYPTFAALELYCYRVAGVVGLMMCHAMGVSNPVALRHAVALGNAMQMTNIARDVAEDAARGRCYLPTEWPRDTAVRLLLEKARENYRFGRQGLRYLSFRSALAVGAASYIYEEIGQMILRSGESMPRGRTVVSLPRKLVCVLKGLAAVARTLPYRLRHPWVQVSLEHGAQSP